MRTTRSRILAWIAAGVLILSLTLAGVIIHLGRFPGTDTGATAPGITSTVSAGGQSQPPIRTSALKPPGTKASISPNDSTRSANGSGRMD